ncbi:3-phosphoshikimate 1-carboxyvinyltransferase [Candidatus Peregrinibacteria bacterium RIFOXYB2_FULL_32_7]|nr:MAG: 3-phosphoshikimate 1-carboxyvinyltransferase [Candidatus Peregrinibacteria bacterium RIFOXYB2_FULL_32_7]
MLIKHFTSPIKASLKVPGSKSYTNRAFIISALAKGKSIIKDALISDDTKYMAEALKQIGVEIKQNKNNFEIKGTNGLKTIKGKDTLTKHLYLGNAGTATRFLTAAMCLSKDSDKIIDGSERMHLRPISDLVEGLRQLGAKIDYIQQITNKSKNSQFTIHQPDNKQILTIGLAGNSQFSNCPPLLIHQTGLKGGTCKIPGDKSSQYFSAIMISAPYAENPVTIEVIGDLVSKPYLDITIEIMKNFGVNVINKNYKKFIIPIEQKYYSREYKIEADASSASYFFGIAAATGSEITVENAKYDSLQGDIKFIDVIEKMGCRRDTLPSFAKATAGKQCVSTGIQITGPKSLNPLGHINLCDLPDAAMTVAILCSLAKGKSILTGLSNLRIKETDRLKALATELQKIGCEVKELDDGLEINGNPTKLHGATIETYDDHRIAMCFAVLGTKIPGIIIKNPDCVNKTYPEFWKDLKRIY